MEQRIPIASRNELPERGSKKFTFERDGVTEEGFLIRYKGRFFAYRNLCNHIPLKMDQDTGQFFSPSGNNLVCKNHGAMFDPLTGKCILGPPKGKYLKWLSIAVGSENIFLVLKDARAPAGAPVAASTSGAPVAGEGGAASDCSGDAAGGDTPSCLSDKPGNPDSDV